MGWGVIVKEACEWGGGGGGVGSLRNLSKKHLEIGVVKVIIVCRGKG